MKSLTFVLFGLISVILTSCQFPGVAANYEQTSLVQTASGFSGFLKLITPMLSDFGQDLPQLKFNIEFQTATRVHVEISDPLSTRWRVPDIATASVSEESFDKKYSFSMNQLPFNFAVTRANSGADPIFDTRSTKTPSIVFKENYLEISTKISNRSHIYGFGERSQYLELDRSKSYTLWSLDNYGLPVDQNLYGSHPFFLNYKAKEGSKVTAASGIFLLNSNGMEISFSGEVMTYRIIGGILDFYIFLGPTPEQVVQQYLDVIGRPQMIPYWSLGYHQCRWGYPNLNAVKEVVDRFAAEKIPLETVWTDIDAMDQSQVFTFDPVNFPAADVKSFVDGLHAKGQKYVTIVDPGVAVNPNNPTYQRGINQGVFIKNAVNNDNYVGNVWPGGVHFPDWLHPNATSFWTTEISQMSQSVSVDGLWIDMNEPSNFASDPPTSSTLFPLNNGGQHQPLNWKTIPMNARHYVTTHDNVHNLYGHLEAVATRKALEQVRGKRSFVISRSTFPGSGKHAGHWLGDNNSSWEDLRNSIAGVLNFNMFGIPLVGADICGFVGNTTEELCARWMQLGAFYPFARNHNSKDAIPQEPYRWPKVQSAAKSALNTRYLILPYYYLLFFRAHTTGSMVIKPLFFDFPDQESRLKPLWEVKEQLLIGNSLLLSPVLTPNATSVTAFLPSGPRWFDFQTGEEATSTGWITLPASFESVNLHIKGGSIVPTQTPALTTKKSRENAYSLVIALDSSRSAKGSLYVDDGESLVAVADKEYLLVDFEFEINSTHANLISTVVNKFSEATSFALPPLDSFTVLGFTGPVFNISGHPNEGSLVVTYSQKSKVLKVSNLDLKLTSDFALAFSTKIVGGEGSGGEEIPTPVSYVGVIIIVVLVALILLAAVAYLSRHKIRAAYHKRFGGRMKLRADEDEVETYFPSGDSETHNPVFRGDLDDEDE